MALNTVETVINKLQTYDPHLEVRLLICNDEGLMVGIIDEIILQDDGRIYIEGE